MSEEAYGIVIVGTGAGPGGCVVASCLAEHTAISIALIEAGGTDRDPFTHITTGFARILAYDRHVWKYETVPQHSAKRACRSGRVLGGSSINTIAYVRGQTRDCAAWQAVDGGTGKWSYEDLLPGFMARKDNDSFHDEYHGIDGGPAVQLSEGVDKLNQNCLKPFQRCRVPFNPDHNGKSQIGVSFVQSTVENQRRCSAVDAFPRPHLASGRVTLLTGKTVVRNLIESKRAVGMELGGNGLETILAGEVALSAEAVHSPTVLMHSGVGPAEQLPQRGIAAIVDSPELGENQQDHPMVPGRAYMKGSLGYQAAAHRLGTMKAGPLYLVAKDGPASGDGRPLRQGLRARSDSAQEPRMARLADSDPTSMPLINPNVIGEEEDLRAVVQSAHAIRKAIAREPLAPVIQEQMEREPRIHSDADIGECTKRTLTTMWHPVGTCRMDRDERSMADARLKGRGVDCLR